MKKILSLGILLIILQSINAQSIYPKQLTTPCKDCSWNLDPVTSKYCYYDNKNKKLFESEWTGLPDFFIIPLDLYAFPKTLQYDRTILTIVNINTCAIVFEGDYKVKEVSPIFAKLANAKSEDDTSQYFYFIKIDYYGTYFPELNTTEVTTILDMNGNTFIPPTRSGSIEFNQKMESKSDWAVWDLSAKGAKYDYKMRDMTQQLEDEKKRKDLEKEKAKTDFIATYTGKPLPKACKDCYWKEADYGYLAYYDSKNVKLGQSLLKSPDQATKYYTHFIQILGNVKVNGVDHKSIGILDTRTNTIVVPSDKGYDNFDYKLIWEQEVNNYLSPNKYVIIAKYWDNKIPDSMAVYNESGKDIVPLGQYKELWVSRDNYNTPKLISYIKLEDKTDKAIKTKYYVDENGSVTKNAVKDILTFDNVTVKNEQFVYDPNGKKLGGGVYNLWSYNYSKEYKTLICQLSFIDYWLINTVTGEYKSINLQTGFTYNDRYVIEKIYDGSGYGNNNEPITNYKYGYYDLKEKVSKHKMKYDNIEYFDKSFVVTNYEGYWIIDPETAEPISSKYYKMNIDKSRTFVTATDFNDKTVKLDAKGKVIN